MSDPLLAARQVMIESTDINFDEEKDPDGIDWEPLSINYGGGVTASGPVSPSKIKRESAHPTEILQLSGDGRAKATSEEAWIIAEDTLFFNPEALPVSEKDGRPYMSFHQSGTQSEALGSALQKLRIGGTLSNEEKAALATPTSGRGKNLPRRQFIGITAFDRELIEGIFRDWFDENIIEEFPPGGGAGPNIVQETGFNVLGEFPIVGYTTSGQPLLKLPSGKISFGRKNR